MRTPATIGSEKLSSCGVEFVPRLVEHSRAHRNSSSAQSALTARHHGRNPASRHNRCIARRRTRAGLRERNAGNPTHKAHAHAHAQPAAPNAHTPRPAPSQHHAETRHPGTADAAHRHARAGLRERDGPKPTRGARAPRHTTSQHRLGRRRRGSDAGWRTLLVEIVRIFVTFVIKFLLTLCSGIGFFCQYFIFS